MNQVWAFILLHFLVLRNSPIGANQGRHKYSSGRRHGVWATCSQSLHFLYWSYLGFILEVPHFHLKTGEYSTHLTFRFGRFDNTQESSSGDMVIWCLLVMCSICIRAQQHSLLLFDRHIILYCRWHDFAPELKRSALWIPHWHLAWTRNSVLSHQAYV